MANNKANKNKADQYVGKVFRHTLNEEIISCSQWDDETKTFTFEDGSMGRWQKRPVGKRGFEFAISTQEHQDCMRSFAR